ncbi:MAG TPA: hypothetical protein DCP38_13285 [Acidobacteria bacterium]|nr:hypothetical protein [Acidobacteriota bacterium]HAK56432.1 hypothetical protein [Acidobacteriota bacterium]
MHGCRKAAAPPSYSTTSKGSNIARSPRCWHCGRDVEVAGAQGPAASPRMVARPRPRRGRTSGRRCAAGPVGISGIAAMSCAQFEDAIGELVDSTLDPSARDALNRHLEGCAACRALVDDFRELRVRAAELPRQIPPNRVWSSIAAALDDDADAGSAATRGGVAGEWWRQASWRGLAAAAVIVIVAGTAVWMLPDVQPPNDATAPIAADAEAAETIIESVEVELRLAEEHYENAISGLEQIATFDEEWLDPDVSATFEKNLGVIDQAIAESRAALRDEPTNQVARESLFDVMWRKVTLLQDTIALVNEMRKGNEDGAARIVEGLNRH